MKDISIIAASVILSASILYSAKMVSDSNYEDVDYDNASNMTISIIEKSGSATQRSPNELSAIYIETYKNILKRLDKIESN